MSAPVGAVIGWVQRSNAASLSRWAFLALCAAWGLVSLWFPFAWDQGIMALIGDVVLRGDMPYRDAFETKGPLAFVLYAIPQALFGRSQIGIRVLDLILLAGSAFLLGRAGARLSRPSVGWWVAIAFVLAYASQTFFSTAQPDGAAALLLVMGLAPLLAQPITSRAALVAGLTVGLASLVKPFNPAYLAIPAIAALMADEKVSVRFRTVALTLVGFAAPVVAMAAWFLARGALDDLVADHLLFSVVNYSGLATFDVRLTIENIIAFFSSGPRTGAAAFVVFGAWAIWRGSRRAAILLISWALIAIGTVALQGKFFPYHWTAALPPLILLGGLGVGALTTFIAPADEERRSVTTPQMLAIVATAFLVVPFAVRPARDVKNWLRYVTGLDSRQEYYRRFVNPNGGLFSAGDEMEAGAYLRAHTSPGDRIANMGYSTVASYLSGRRDVSRFIYNGPLVNWRVKTDVQRVYRADYIADVERSKPLYVLVGMQMEPKKEVLAEFPEFTRLLDREYALERTFGTVDLYRRKDSP